MSLGAKPQRSEVESDNLKDRYTSAADDAGSSERKREAAMLFSVAEEHVNQEEPAEVLKSTEDALAIFRELEDRNGEADTLRLILHAYRLQADTARGEGDSQEVRAVLKQAEALASSELEKFRDSADKRSQACMLLSLAELNFNLRGSRKRDEALDTASEALELFAEVQDAKMEAVATLMMAKIHYKKHNVGKAKRFALEAVSMFQALGEKKGEAQSLLTVGAIDVLDCRIDDGMRWARKAQKLFIEIGDKKQQGLTFYSLAQWHLNKDDGHGALPMARESLARFREIHYGNGWEASALGLLAEAYVLQNKGKEALEVAQDGLERFREAGASRDMCRTLLHIANAYLAIEDYEQALQTATECVVLCRDLQDKKWQSNMLETVAHIHLTMKNEEKAKEAAYEAVEILKEIGATKDECEARMHMLARILVQTDNYKEAAKAAQEARALAQKKDDRSLEAWAMLATCGTYGMVDEIEKAIKAGTLAAELFHEEGDKKGEAKALKGLSDILLATQDFEGALRSAKKAEAVMQDFGDKRWLAKMKHAVAHVHLMGDNAAEAAKVALEALKICRAEEDLRGTLQMLFLVVEANLTVLGDMREETQKARAFGDGCNKALRFTKEAIGLSVKLGDKASEALANYWCGNVHILMGKVNELAVAANAALKLWRELDDKLGEVRAMTLLAQSLIMKGDNKAAMSQLNEALQLSREADDRIGEKQVQELIESISGPKGQVPTMAPAQEQQQPLQQLEAQPGASSAAGVSLYKAPDPMMVRTFIINLVQNMTGSSEDVEGDIPLMESGIDSLASVELRTQLQQEFKLNLPSTVMFNYPTIASMTRLLVDECSNKKISWGG